MSRRERWAGEQGHSRGGKAWLLEAERATGRGQVSGLLGDEAEGGGVAPPTSR